MKIFIDAGHGNGGDPGAVGKLGTREADIALAVSKIVRAELSKLGYEIAYTRDGETSFPQANGANLSRIVSLANAAKADFFISLHCNSGGETAEGIEIYISARGGRAEKLAAAVQKAVVSATGQKDRGVRVDNEALGYNLYVLENTTMPAILVELAFISNLREEFMLASPLFQSVIGRAIAAGAHDYIKGVTATVPKAAYKEIFCKEVLPEHAGIYVADKAASSIDVANFITGGFFGTEKSGKTYPAVHLADSGRVLTSIPRAMPTLVVANGKADIIMCGDLQTVPGLRLALGGIAVKMPNASDYDYKAQGFDDSWDYDTVHAVFGIRDGKIHACLVSGTWAGLKAYAEDKGFEKAIAGDGGSSVVCRDNGKWIAKTTKRISSVFMWEQ